MTAWKSVPNPVRALTSSREDICSGFWEHSQPTELTVRLPKGPEMINAALALCIANLVA